MRVFILCSGRSGSVSFIKACDHIGNFSAGHESKAKDISRSKFDYPNYHIEADNRMSWFLGHLDKKYGDTARYVVLKRDRELTIQSFNQRWSLPGNIIKAFSEGILMNKQTKLSEEDKVKTCELYYDTVYNNVDLFLKDKSMVLNMDLENIKSDFERFWNWIGAEGNLELALKVFDTSHNQTQKAKKKWWF